MARRPPSPAPRRTAAAQQPGRPPTTPPRWQSTSSPSPRRTKAASQPTPRTLQSRSRRRQNATPPASDAPASPVAPAPTPKTGSAPKRLPPHPRKRSTRNAAIPSVRPIPAVVIALSTSAAGSQSPLRSRQLRPRRTHRPRQIAGKVRRCDQTRRGLAQAKARHHRRQDRRVDEAPDAEADRHRDQPAQREGNGRPLCCGDIRHESALTADRAMQSNDCL